MTNNFGLEWERFLHGFDSVEEVGAWDKEEYGEMEVFCENILISVLMHFISVDGKVTVDEVNTLNKMFDFKFSFEYVEELCQTMGSELEDYVEAPHALIKVIADANKKIADEFKRLLINSCEIIVESDDVKQDEDTELKDFIANLSKV